MNGPWTDFYIVAATPVMLCLMTGSRRLQTFTFRMFVSLQRMGFTNFYRTQSGAESHNVIDMLFDCVRWYNAKQCLFQACFQGEFLPPPEIFKISRRENSYESYKLDQSYRAIIMHHSAPEFTKSHTTFQKFFEGYTPDPNWELCLPHT